jgi:2-iminobutanoate/2-iminopropanoate deaminase
MSDSAALPGAVTPGSSDPKPLGPYTPMIRAGEWLICSGQIGLKDGALVEGGISAQVAQAVENISALLTAAGASLNSVVKTTVFLADIGDYRAMNDAYVRAFASHRPARSAFAVAALPMGAAVEIEAWAYQK